MQHCQVAMLGVRYKSVKFGARWGAALIRNSPRVCEPYRGGLFLMSEVHLYRWVEMSALLGAFADRTRALEEVQGYLARKKQPHP